MISSASSQTSTALTEFNEMTKCYHVYAVDYTPSVVVSSKRIAVLCIPMAGQF